MSLAIDCVLIDCNDLQRMSQFWRAALDLEHVWTGPSGGYLLMDAHGTTRLGLMPSSEEKGGKNRVHLDLRPDDQETEIERLEVLGAIRVDVGQRDVPWVVMADPEGNEFCVLRSRESSHQAGGVTARGQAVNPQVVRSRAQASRAAVRSDVARGSLRSAAAPPPPPRKSSLGAAVPWRSV